MSVITAPAGWGWNPAAIIAGLSPDDLPELPFLRMLRPVVRNAAITESLRDNPQLLKVIEPKHLVRRYGLPQVTASTVLARARAA